MKLNQDKTKKNRNNIQFFCVYISYIISINSVQKNTSNGIFFSLFES